MHPKLYTYGYKKIEPLAPEMEGEEWSYSLQLHKNQNGKHWDFRLHRPGEDRAYSWAMKKPPIGSLTPRLATRTHDHSLTHMSFEGPMVTAKGTGTVQLVSSGKVKVTGVDKDGIRFKWDKAEYRLRPYKDKRYMFEQILY